MPLMRCMKLRTTRSARRMLCALPRISQKTSPFAIQSPSRLLHDTSRSPSTAARIWLAKAWPARTPSALARSVASLTVDSGMLREGSGSEEGQSAFRESSLQATPTRAGLAVDG